MSSKKEVRKEGGGAVRRYRPGERPAWMAEESDSEGEGEGTLLQNKVGTQKGMSINVAGDLGRDSRQQAVVVRTRERRVVAPAVVAISKKTERVMEKAETSTGEPIRRPTRERQVVVPVQRHHRREGGTAKQKGDNNDVRDVDDESKSGSDGNETDSDDSDETDSDDSDETDSDDSDDAPIARPVFVQKADRRTLAERDAIEKEELAAIELKKKQASQQVMESRKIAKQKIEAELALEEAARAGPQGADEVITDDDEDPAGDYELWKEREMLRLRRLLERLLREEEEQKEKEAWAKMSDDDKAAYLAAKNRAARKGFREKAEVKKAEREERERGNGSAGGMSGERRFGRRPKHERGPPAVGEGKGVFFRET